MSRPYTIYFDMKRLHLTGSELTVSQLYELNQDMHRFFHHLPGQAEPSIPSMPLVPTEPPSGGAPDWPDEIPITLPPGLLSEPHPPEGIHSNMKTASVNIVVRSQEEMGDRAREMVKIMDLMNEFARG